MCFTISNSLESRKPNNWCDLRCVFHKIRCKAERLSSTSHTGPRNQVPSAYIPSATQWCHLQGLCGERSLPIRPALYRSPCKASQQPGCSQTENSQPLSLRDTQKLSSVGEDSWAQHRLHLTPILRKCGPYDVCFRCSQSDGHWRCKSHWWSQHSLWNCECPLRWSVP